MQIFNSNNRNNSTTQATTMLPLIKPMKSKSKLRVGSNKKRKYHIHSNNNPHYAHTQKISMTKIEIKPKPFAINCYNNSTEEDKPINKLQILLEVYYSITIDYFNCLVREIIIDNSKEFQAIQS